MKLWITWWDLVAPLRPAFSRTRTFLWFATALAAFCTRGDLRGVTSFVRALGLRERYYDRLLDFFHSPAVDLGKLTVLWTGLVLKVLGHLLLTVNGRIVLLADGIKAPKTGRRMPAVKKLHQESQNNTKPEYIYGHSCQAFAVVVRAATSFFALPLACRIHEGVVFSNRDKRTLMDKLILLLGELGALPACYLVADAYYAAASIIRPLLRSGHHLVTAARSTAVAYELAPTPTKRGRGRPRRYGPKHRLRDFFRDAAAFTEAVSPVYGEQGVKLRYRSVDLCWRPVGCLVRFVMVIHPLRGRRILLATDLTLDPLEIIRLYGVRFKIEVSFKQAVHTVGVYGYHFWMAAMTPRTRRSGNQHLHHKSEIYREQVRRKIRAYHCYIQTGVIAQGLLQVISLLQAPIVWQRFGSWIRTIRPGILPSEQIVSLALQYCLPEFLAGSEKTLALAKFIRERLDPDRAEGLRLAS